MSASIYGNVGGVSRKAKELYGDVGGVTRKLKSVYANVNGVTRKIFSGYDCRAKVIPMECGISVIREDGSGQLGVSSGYYDDGSKYYFSYIDFYFDQPLSFVDGSTESVEDLADSQKIILNYTQDEYCLVYEQNVQIGVWDKTFDASNASKNWSAWQTEQGFCSYFDLPQRTIRMDGSGSSTYFRVGIRALLDPQEDRDDARMNLIWGAGAIKFLGKQINSIELI